jgi:hypothetical protein
MMMRIKFVFLLKAKRWEKVSHQNSEGSIAISVLIEFPQLRVSTGDDNFYRPRPHTLHPV